MPLLKPLTVLMTLAAGAAQAATEPRAVVEHYADLGHAVYQDALVTARLLDASIERLVDDPSQQTLAAARQAWKAARVPYQQSEVFRFGNPIVDAWEGGLNAWPLDEGLIDYVAESDYGHELGNPVAEANIIANPELRIGADSIKTEPLTPDLLADLHELAGSEANVTTGYHAIEFLLWGQDLNGTGPGAGERPYTDYVQGEGCTHGHCQRRGAYLKAAGDLLVRDLEYMVGEWAPGDADNYRAQLVGGDSMAGLTALLYGMGSLSLGELAGERMKVALEAHSPEDEHDCFSDNTHNSHFYNALGVRNIYLGEYRRTNGTRVSGPSVSDLVKAVAPELDQQLRAALNTTVDSVQTMVDTAESGTMAFDQMIAPGNDKGHAIVAAAINNLVEQTALIEQAATAVGVSQLNPDTAAHQF